MRGRRDSNGNLYTRTTVYCFRNGELAAASNIGMNYCRHHRFSPFVGHISCIYDDFADIFDQQFDQEEFFA